MMFNTESLHNITPLAILMLCPQYRPLIGGYERAAERLSASLAAKGISVVVVTERRDKNWLKVEHVDSYVIRRLPCWYRRGLHISSSLLSFAWYLLSDGRKFDVWHVHQYGYHAALAVAMGILLKRPVVLKLTSSKEMGICQALGNGISGRILATLHRRVDICLALTSETREEAIRFGIPADRVHLVPNGINAFQFHPSTHEGRLAARKALGLSCRHLILSVGRIAPEKNTLGLVDAWALLEPEQREGALLAIVGDGPDAANVALKVKNMGLTGSVLLAGSRQDVDRWYQAADLYVMASHHEGLSNTMIEALASGLPVVATRVSGSSILEEPPSSGIVVDVGNMEQFSRAIGKLLNNEQMREKLSVNARQTFESNFSMERLVPQFLEIYKQLY